MCVSNNWIEYLLENVSDVTMIHSIIENHFAKKISTVQMIHNVIHALNSWNTTTHTHTHHSHWYGLFTLQMYFYWWFCSNSKILLKFIALNILINLSCSSCLVVSKQMFYIKLSENFIHLWHFINACIEYIDWWMYDCFIYTSEKSSKKSNENIYVCSK